MTRTEEVPHLRKLFKNMGYDYSACASLVEKIRDIALEYLPPAVIAKVPRPYFADDVRAVYAGRGVSPEWDLKIAGATGYRPFWFASRGTPKTPSKLTPSQHAAAALLFHCMQILEDEDFNQAAVENILDAYAGLDHDAIHEHHKTIKQRSAGGSHSPYSEFSRQIEQLLDEYIADGHLKNQASFQAAVKEITKKTPAKDTIRSWATNRNEGRFFLDSGKGK